MSHANGQIQRANGEIFHCEYNGTVDVMLPFLYTTYEEMRTHWRRMDWKNCYCPDNGKHETVIIATDYGGGFSWEGKVCFNCNIIVLHLSPHYDTMNNKLPDWWVR